MKCGNAPHQLYESACSPATFRQQGSGTSFKMSSVIQFGETRKVTIVVASNLTFHRFAFIISTFCSNAQK